MSIRYISISITFFFFANTMLFAQLVNVEKSRKENKEGIQGFIQLNLSLTQNTRQIFETGTQAHIQYNKNQHTILLLNTLNFMRLEGDDLINNGFQHLRYNYNFSNEFFTFEVFTQHQYNSIRLLQRRFLLGAGPRLRIWENDQFAFFFAPLVMFESEVFNDEKNTKTDKIKGDFYISASYELDKRISFSHTTYYQPDFEYFDQFRLSSETGLEMKFNEKFSFVVSYDLAYDSHPPGDIPKLFYVLKNGIQYGF